MQEGQEALKGDTEAVNENGNVVKSDEEALKGDDKIKCN